MSRDAFEGYDEPVMDMDPEEASKLILQAKASEDSAESEKN